MRALAQKRVWIAAAVTAGLLGVAFWPEALEVETAVVARGPLMVTGDEEGRTRVRDRFVVSAPVDRVKHGSACRGVRGRPGSG